MNFVCLCRDVIIDCNTFFEFNKHCFNTMRESDVHWVDSEAVGTVRVVGDIPMIPKFAPLIMAKVDPVLGMFVELVQMTGSVTSSEVPMWWP